MDIKPNAHRVVVTHIDADDHGVAHVVARTVVHPNGFCYTYFGGAEPESALYGYFHRNPFGDPNIKLHLDLDLNPGAILDIKFNIHPHAYGDAEPDTDADRFALGHIYGEHNALSDVASGDGDEDASPELDSGALGDSPRARDPRLPPRAWLRHAGEGLAPAASDEEAEAIGVGRPDGDAPGPCGWCRYWWECYKADCEPHWHPDENALGNASAEGNEDA